MSNVIPIRSRSAAASLIQQDACLWIVRLGSGLTPDQQSELHAWLASNPEHVARLLEAASVWDQLDVIAELSLVFPLDEYRQPRRRAWYGKLPVSLAAGVLLGFSLYLFAPSRPDPGAEQQSVAVQPPDVYESAVGEQIRATLPDGSELILNTNSRVELAFDAGARKVNLIRGEAHFKVAKDVSRPFRVFASGGIVEAVGTAFAVQETAQHSLEVVVVEGVVNFTPPVQSVAPADSADAQPDVEDDTVEVAAVSPISLAAGEAILFDAEAATVVREEVKPSDIEKRLAWRSGMLLFQGEPLEQVIQEVSRYTSVHFEVDNAIKNTQVLGYFRTGDIDAMLITMRDTFGIVVERVSDDRIILRANR